MRAVGLTDAGVYSATVSAGCGLGEGVAKQVSEKVPLLETSRRLNYSMDDVGTPKAEESWAKLF